MRYRCALAVAVLGALGTLQSPAVAAGQFCDRTGPACAYVPVPLDRAGQVPGTLSLYVEREVAPAATRPPLLLIAGGPGEAATETYSVDRASEVIGAEARARDVLAMDLRGSGRSGRLSCPSLTRLPLASPSVAAATCASALGPRRGLYTAVDAAEDVEALREAIGAPKIALLSISAGSAVALAYAARHPDRVDRLVLDSPVEPGGRDPLQRPSMRAAPRAARAFCRGGACRSWTRDAGADLRRVARRLEQRPLTGHVTGPDGRRRPARIDSAGLLRLLIAGDFDPFVRALGAGAVRSAARGDAAPLLRLHARVRAAAERRRAAPDSETARVLAHCEESDLPWSAAADLDRRGEEARAAIADLQRAELAPFGPVAALGSEILSLCRRWPPPAERLPPAAPLPAVPTLLLAGDSDLYAPLENARAIAAGIRGARLVVGRGGGHVVMSGFDFNWCATRWIARFLATGEPGRCEQRRRPAVIPVPPPPAGLGELHALHGLAARVGRTIGAVRLTVADGMVALWGHGYRDWSGGFAGPGYLSSPASFGALRGGSYRFGDSTEARLRLRHASLVPGVRVSGMLRRTEFGDRIVSGRLRVAGVAAASGTLRLRREMLVGRLGGQTVRVPAQLSPGHNLLKAPIVGGAAR